MIEARGLTKTYGSRVAVDDLTFTVRPGIVTGFLGPNGAGKSTTMRMILGLDRPTSGTVTVDGKSYVDLTAPLGEVGALLDAKGVQPSRPAYDHLRALAATQGIPAFQVDEVLDLVGLTDVAHKSAGSFSLGMGQRLGIAAALLGDPKNIILDEPVNGLDPEGVRWVRHLLRSLAAQGRTILLSSHLMSEMELTADHLIIIGRGRIIRDISMQELRDSTAMQSVLVRTPDMEILRRSLAAPGVTIVSSDREQLQVSGVTAEHIGRVAAQSGVTLFELSPKRASLEDIFMELTEDAVEYHAHELRQEIAA